MSSVYKKMLKSGKPMGEVVSVDSSLVKVKGLYPANIHALVVFADDSKGIIDKIETDHIAILHLGSKPLRVGDTCVLQNEQLLTKVGRGFSGRVVSVMGQPMDGKGPIEAEATRLVFGSAPPLGERQQLDEQLPTGIVAIDSLLPLAKGQRMAIIGDSKSGKTSIASQIAMNQKDSGFAIVYVLIAKRRADVDELVSRLESSGAMDNSVVIVSTINDSLSISYLAPYVGCAMAEYFWQDLHTDTIIVYDDLTTHAMVKREISLLAHDSPGRDSYPGDIFYGHSSLLERAGRIKSSGKTLTALPVVLAPSGDITSYLPTNIMSITDGQWILDMRIFRDGVRPAISTGLSVTRVGGRGHNKRQKEIAESARRVLAAYSNASEFSHFGSELAIEVQRDLRLGRLINNLVTQPVGSPFSLIAQQLMFELILSQAETSTIDLDALRGHSNDLAQNVADEESYRQAYKELQSVSVLEIKK